MAVSPNQTPDCVFYGDSATGTWSELATDDSGEGTDLTAGSSSAYESSSSRANLTSGRAIDIHCEMNDSDTGYLFNWDKGSGVETGLQHNGFGAINVIVDGTQVEQIIPTMSAGAEEEVYICWTTEPNISPKDVTEEMRSEIHWYNADTSVYELFSFTHRAETASASGDLVFGAQDTSDTNAYSATVYKVRLSSRFHTSTETYETFISQSSAPTLAGNEYRPISAPDRTDGEIGNDGHFAGPVFILGAKAAEQHRMLLAAPIVSIQDNIGDFALDDTDFGYLYSEDGIYLRLEHMFYRSVPDHITHVVPNIHFQQNWTGGGKAGSTVLRMYSMNTPNPSIAPLVGGGSFERYYSTDTVSSNHGTGDTDGEWVELDPLRISRDGLGRSCFCIATDIGVGSNVYQARVRAISLDPIVDLSGGGLGIGGLNG